MPLGASARSGMILGGVVNEYYPAAQAIPGNPQVRRHHDIF